MQTRIGVLRNKVFIAASRTLAILSLLVTVAAFGSFGPGSIAHAAGLQRHVPAPGGPSPCPPNSTGYTGNLDPYNCSGIVYDGELHGVWLRKGNADGFGIQHFLTHNLSINVVVDVIEQSSHGIKQPNGRYLYGSAYKDPTGGGVTQQVQVFEERGKPNPPAVNDGGELGVVTAYCMDAFGNQEQVCPDWVNDSL